jgi:uncharacterized protein YkwD
MWRHFRCALMLIIPLLPISAIGQEIQEENLEALQSSERVSAERPSDQSVQVADLVVQQTNEFRHSEHLQNVRPNPKLAQAAQYFANFMAKTDKYGHRADGKRPTDRAEKYGYEYCLISENIAYVYSSNPFSTAELAERFVTGWKNSAGHRKNMLDDAVHETGVGIAQSDKTGYWYAVQMFGRPKSAAIEFSIANHTDSEIKYSLAERTFPLPPRYTRTHTLCRPTEANFDFPEGQGGTEKITPHSGDKFVVVQRAGKYELIRQ